jgi:hypothetical protein
MKHTIKSPGIRLFKTIGLVLTLGTSMTACSSGSEKWKEEVQLSDGKIIVVERETVRERGGGEWAQNSSGSKPKERRITFNLPDGSRQVIEWRSKKIDSQTWPESLVLLDITPSQIAVFSILSISPICEIYSKYVYRGGVWTEETLPEKFTARTTNLLIRDGVDMPKYLNLEAKHKANSDSRYRDALKQVGPSRQVCSS